jgi:hypothetical protein
MAKRQPEGILKDDCRDNHARPNDLIFWQVEGKSCNGFPDSLCGKATGGGIHIEFKRPGAKPSAQQYLRIWEMRDAGIEAWWCDSVADYRKLVRLDPGGYRVVYPEFAKRVIRKKYGNDAV